MLPKDRIPFSENDQDGEPLPPLCANRNFFHGFELLLSIITLGARLPLDAPWRQSHYVLSEGGMLLSVLRGQAVSANITKAGVPKSLPAAEILSPGERHVS